MTIKTEPYSTIVSYIKDLSCNNIIIGQPCTGSLHIATIPSGADIYIYDDIQDEYILRTEKTGSISSPTIIPNIECNSITRSNKFKLSLSGYVDVEGILDIRDGEIYQLYIILEPDIKQCKTAEEGGMLLALIAGGLLISALFGDKKHKKLKDYEKYKEIYE